MTRRKKIAIAALVVLVVLFGYGVKIYRDFSRDMSTLYGTTNTIGKVLDYVETHDGRWPQNWDEIEPWPGVRDLVVVQFDVDIDRLINDPKAIQSAIRPANGRYSDHHHAPFAEQLRQKLIEIHRPNMKAEGVPKLPPRPVDRKTGTGAVSR